MTWRAHKLDLLWMTPEDTIATCRLEGFIWKLLIKSSTNLGLSGFWMIGRLSSYLDELLTCQLDLLSTNALQCFIGTLNSVSTLNFLFQVTIKTFSGKNYVSTIFHRNFQFGSLLNTKVINKEVFLKHRHVLVRT